MAGPHGHGPGHLGLGGIKEPPGEIHSLPEGSVLAADGSTISWSQAANGTITALGGHNEQLVLSRYRPSKTAGIDVLHGGDMTAGTAGPTDAGPSAGDQLVAGVVGNLDASSAAQTSEGAPDLISGLRFVYSTVGQGDAVSYVNDETENVVSIEIIGVLASARYRMKTDGDATNLPSTVSATFLPHHQSLKWEGALDLTQSPVKALARIPGWRLDAFKREFSSAAYFDALATVITEAFGQTGADATKPGVIAKDAEDIAGSAIIWGVIGAGVAIATAPVSVPLSAVTVATYCFGGVVASAASDLWSEARADLKEIEAEPPPNPDIPTTEEPDDGCFAEGTVVALPDSRYVPIARIAVGDLVASREESSLDESARRVTRTWKHQKESTLDVSLDT